MEGLVGCSLLHCCQALVQHCSISPVHCCQAKLHCSTSSTMHHPPTSTILWKIKQKIAAILLPKITRTQKKDQLGKPNYLKLRTIWWGEISTRNIGWKPTHCGNCKSARETALVLKFWTHILFIWESWGGPLVGNVLFKGSVTSSHHSKILKW